MSIFSCISKHFRFEDQLQECAAWLGIAMELPKIDSTEDKFRPNLTYEEEKIVRKIYENDIILWESIQN
jgi:hypothetical protein